MTKTFKLILMVGFFLFAFTGVYAQDEIYNEEPKQEVVESPKVEISDSDFDEYYTEQDYYENEQNKNRTENVLEDEYADEKNREHQKRRNSDVAVGVAAEIIFEVVINSIFIIASFWN